MYGFKILIDGDYACFTRPEMKVERVSYDVPTPGALEGMLKSVYWKPAIRYVIDKIVVYNPIRFMNVRRNEVKNKINANFVLANIAGAKRDLSIYTSECRSQRSAMILKNVRYGVEFHFEMTGIQSEHEDECEEKHYGIIQRRLENGQYFKAPCLGCSEFPVRHIVLTDSFNETEIATENVGLGDVDLGYMLYRLNFGDNKIPVDCDWKDRKFSDRANAVFYRPHMVNGIIDVRKYREGMIC